MWLITNHSLVMPGYGYFAVLLGGSPPVSKWLVMEVETEPVITTGMSMVLSKWIISPLSK